jgi:hypothetical protein
MTENEVKSTNDNVAQPVNEALAVQEAYRQKLADRID